jgi:hypothetical protein
LYGGGATASLKITYTGVPQTVLVFPVTLNSMVAIPPVVVSGQATYTAVAGATISSFVYTEVGTTAGTLLLTLSFDDLVGIGGTCSPNTIASLTTLSFPELVSVGGTCSPNTMASLTTLSFPELVSVGGACSPATMASLTTLSFPKLTYVGGACSPNTMASLTTLSYPELISIGSACSPATMASLTTLSFPKLTYVGGACNPNAMASLTTLSFPKMVTFGSTIAINSNLDNITSIILGTIGTLKTITGATINCSGQKLTAECVDGILALLVSLDGTSGTTLWGAGKTLTINGGTNAAPTFTGTTATPAGSSFVGLTTTCTVTMVAHGYSTGDLLTISGIATLTNANGIFSIIKDTDDIFHYTIVTQTATGAGTASVKKAGSIIEGYYYGQVLKVRGATITTN